MGQCLSFGEILEIHWKSRKGINVSIKSCECFKVYIHELYLRAENRIGDKKGRFANVGATIVLCRSVSIRLWRTSKKTAFVQWMRGLT